MKRQWKSRSGARIAAVVAAALCLCSAISAHAQTDADLQRALGGAAADANDDGRYNEDLTGKARTAMFGVAAKGRKFVYLIDRSASTGGSGATALRAAKQELIRSLKPLGQTQQFQIIFYNEKPSVFNPTGLPRTVFATDQNKELAVRFVESIQAAGGTRHDDALALAAKLKPDVVFWLTDADEPKLDPAEVNRIANLAAGTVIHAIEFGSTADPEKDNFLKQIARQTGGEYRYVDVRKLVE